MHKDVHSQADSSERGLIIRRLTHDAPAIMIRWGHTGVVDAHGITLIEAKRGGKQADWRRRHTHHKKLNELT